MPKQQISVAILDIAAATRRSSLAATLGWQDVRQRYRRSALGPLWLTISMGVMIATIGTVFGTIFRTPLAEFFPFLSIGIILWGFISTTVTEGCLGFISAEGIIKQLPIPLFVHILRLLWRNILIFFHNLIIFPLVLLAMREPPHWTMLVSVLGFGLLLVNLSWLSLLLSLICARYRDLAQIVTSVLQVVFYLTPIVWMPKTLPHRAGVFLLNFNPAFHLIEVVRAPLLGELPTATNWVFSIVLGIVGWSVTLLMYGHYKRRVAYWL